MKANAQWILFGFKLGEKEVDVDVDVIVVEVEGMRAGPLESSAREGEGFELEPANPLEGSQ